MIGLGLSVVQIAVRQLLGFDPKSLFAASEPGVWYDPSDINLAWRRNLLTYTEQFENAAWLKYNSSAVANSTSAPDGTLTADTFSQSSAVGAIYVSFGASGTCTFSVFAKENTNRYFALIVGQNATTEGLVVFDLRDGVVGQTRSGALTTNVSGSISSVGGGWYRCAITYSITRAENHKIELAPALTGNTLDSNGEITGNTPGNSVYLWGAQLEVGSTASTYQRITDGVADYFTYQPQPVMFQDAAGTTPVTAVEQPVGLILDKSKGLVLGPELVTNGDFSSGTTGWTNSSIGTSTLTVVNGQLVASYTDGSNFARAVQTITCTAGALNKISFQNAGLSSVRLRIGASAADGANLDITVSPGVTDTRYFFAASASRVLTFQSTGVSAAVIDNISVRELPGFHATQATATSRPVLSARYNVLERTDQPANAYWTKTNSSVVGNAVFETSITGLFGISRLNPNPSMQVPAGVAAKFSAKVKANGRNFCLLFEGLWGRYFDITPGSSGAVLGGYNANTPQATITPLEDDWFLCEIIYPSPATWHPQIYVSDTGARATYAGDPTKGILVRDIDLRPANQASLPYQRVNTATDYDADPSKFKPYLRFDGVDDWLVTPTITPGTDKAQVFAGVRKLSDAANAMLTELSADRGPNAGAFSFFAPGGSPAGTDRFAFVSKGTQDGVASTSSSAYNAPITVVATGTGNISGDSAILRVNGNQAAISTADQGTGNYLAYPLYIGRRGGTTLPFNGHLYGLIVRFGANLPAGTIASTETWLNQRTGAY